MSFQIQALKRIAVVAASNEFRYAMTNRPVSIGTCPKDFIAVEDRPRSSSIHYAAARNGVAVYSRKLTDAETKNFEMSPMIENEDPKGLQEYVEAVLEGFGKYAARYAEDAEDDMADFEGQVYQKLKSKVKGYIPSLDIKNLTKLVLKEIHTDSARFP